MKQKIKSALTFILTLVVVLTGTFGPAQTTPVFAAGDIEIPYSGGSLLSENVTIDANKIEHLTNIINSGSVSGGEMSVTGTAWKDGYDAETRQGLKYLDIPAGETVFADTAVLSHSSAYDMVMTVKKAYNTGTVPKTFSIITDGASLGNMGHRYVTGTRGGAPLYEMTGDPVFFSIHIDIYKSGTKERIDIPRLYNNYMDIDNGQSFRCLSEPFVKSAMFARSVADLDTSVSGSTLYHNMFVNNMIYSQTGRDAPWAFDSDDRANVYHLENKLAVSGTDIVMGFSGPAVSTLGISSERYRASYAAVNGSVAKSGENVWAGLTPSGTSNTPDTHYHFVKWTADKRVTLTDGTGIAAGKTLTADQIKNVVMTEDVTFTAFNEKDPKVTYLSDENGSISGKKSEYVAVGGRPTGTAESPAEGYKTLYWKADQDLVSADGTAYPAGTAITGEKLTSMIIQKDVVFKVFHQALLKVVYQTDGHGTITGPALEYIDPEKSARPKGSAEEPAADYLYHTWRCDKSVFLADGTKIPAGADLEMSSIVNVVVSEDLVFTAYNRPVPQLSVEKKTDREEYNGADTILYTITVKEVLEDTWASDVVITDINTEGVVFDTDNITASKGTVTVEKEGASGREKEGTEQEDTVHAGKGTAQEDAVRGKTETAQTESRGEAGTEEAEKDTADTEDTEGSGTGETTGKSDVEMKVGDSGNEESAPGTENNKKNGEEENESTNTSDSSKNTGKDSALETDEGGETAGEETKPDPQVKAGDTKITVVIDRLAFEDGEAVITIPAHIDPETFVYEEAVNTASAVCAERPDEPVSDRVAPPVYWNIETSVTGGTITPSARIPNRGSFTAVYQPEPGYFLESVTLDGEGLDPAAFESETVFENVRANHRLDVIYRKTPALSIEKTSDKDVYQGNENIVYTIRAAQTVEDAFATNVVIRDGNAEGVIFDLDSIIVSKGELTVSDETSENGVRHQAFEVRCGRLDYGEDVIITFNAHAGEDLKDEHIKNAARVSCDEPAEDAEDSTDAEVYYSVLTTVKNGTVTPSEERLSPGTFFRAEYSPEEGYRLASVTADGEEVDIRIFENEFSFENIHADHTLDVVYEKIPTPPETKPDPVGSDPDDPAPPADTPSPEGPVTVTPGPAAVPSGIPAKTEKTAPVRTGDDHDLPAWYSLAAAAAAGVVISLVFYRRKFRR